MRARPCHEESIICTTDLLSQNARQHIEATPRLPALPREPLLPFVSGVTLLACCWLLAGCAGETVFQSDFAKFPIHSPPIGNQKIGTTAVDPLSDQYVWATGASGSVWISREDTDPVP